MAIHQQLGQNDLSVFVGIIETKAIYLSENKLD